MSSGTGNYSTFNLMDRKYFSFGREPWLSVLIPSELLVSAFVPYPSTISVHCNLWCEMSIFPFPTDSLFIVNREVQYLTQAFGSFSHLPATSLSLPQHLGCLKELLKWHFLLQVCY